MRLLEVGGEFYICNGFEAPQLAVLVGVVYKVVVRELTQRV